MSAVRSLRKLGRAALLGPSPRHALPHAIEHLAKAHRAHHPGADLDILRRAYVLAESSHRGQTRKSGEPYITHPLAVTLILAELGAETTTLTASLLHDTVEDTEVTLEQVREEFGEEVSYLVDGVTKLEKVDYGAAAEPETFRKMLVATGSDVRVMSIKLADRLHNMRTLGVMRPEKQARIAKVTRDVLIPLAERLGVQALKTELEDLVFAILHPEEYTRTRELIRAHNAEPDPLDGIAEAVRGVLREAGIAAEVHIRPRHFLSVHRALAKRGGLGPCDFGRLLILVAENADCYAVLGELHTCFTPLMSEFKDFIAVPKFNLYQSLHTAVADPAGRVAEVLVRTRRMHRVAEAGVIALGDPHHAPGADRDGAGAAAGDAERVDPTRPGWLERLLEWQSHAPDPDTFWDELRDDLAQDREITVFCTDPGSTTPVATLHLPAGATCVDAAYARYGAAGHALVGARVDGRLTALGTVLRDGDAIQLLMAPAGTSGPSPQWLEYARTPTARIAIRTWIDSRPEEDGRADRADGTGRPSPVPGARTAGRDVCRGGDGAVSGTRDRHRERPAAVAAPGGAPVRLARCCTPVPPDDVVGFAVRGGAVTAHRENCPTVARMTAGGRTTVPVRWQASGAGCRVTLYAESLSRPHLLADLTEAIAGEGVAVVSAAVEPPREQRVRHKYTLELPEAGDLPRLMRAMREVPGVYDVVRATRGRRPSRGGEAPSK
ncbi:bifunctional (p)ppGpp synthetase/guanosine-3',5'-bis(diphosphate) 3'-pyrophosphohydrolase [Streptomyces carminius]|uniref:Bifunctional (P)ppGpp synthetase/guanosine-3',5'-bis(Diphosphate) 3'-pyrophosphohydrolase n=1 Tax=Streptomyces carminius TaxID=2665496 RepID=A0A2M8MD07_9ACTN|nr:HD domain-containing protein [Streptomyces carminius]PJF02054.1 bifunctional (p)ppGpp synthetase/guanosine-3',5'-bis(diphosphate) 3'-pyrophosphohydrolase [Streptomyces carminius]